VIGIYQVASQIRNWRESYNFLWSKQGAKARAKERAKARAKADSGVRDEVEVEALASPTAPTSLASPEFQLRPKRARKVPARYQG
jgi:hypothetical protein